MEKMHGNGGWNSAKKRDFVAYYIYDEPDGRDYSEGKAISLFPMYRIGYMAQILIDNTARLHELDPNHLTWLEIDNTFKPANWRIYGQVSDIACTDPYGLQDAINPMPLDYVIYACTELRTACAPQPMHITLGTFKNVNVGFQRHPTPFEARTMLYYALANGATGINYFLWPSDKRCKGLNQAPELSEEITKLNREMTVGEDLLARSTPIPGTTVQSNCKNLWAQPLLVNENNMIVVFANHSYKYEDWQSKDGKYTVEKLENVVIEVEIPPYVTVNDVCRIDWDGVKDLKWEKIDNKNIIRINISDASDAGMIVLTSDSSILRKNYSERIAEKLEKMEKDEKESSTTAK